MIDSKDNYAISSYDLAPCKRKHAYFELTRKIHSIVPKKSKLLPNFWPQDVTMWPQCLLPFRRTFAAVNSDER